MKKTFLLLLIVAASQMKSQCTTTVAPVAAYGGPGTYTIAANGFLGPFKLCGNAILYDTMGCSNRRYYVESGSTLYLKNTFFDYVWLAAGSQLVNMGGIGDIYVYKDNASGATGLITPAPTICVAVSFPSPTNVPCPSPTVTGLSSNYFHTEVSFYPNPANDKLMISNPTSNPLSVTLSDLTGRVVRRTEFSEKEKALDLTDLSEGCYFVRFSSGSSILTKKVVISR